MKKLIAIIVLLLIIFISMYIYKTNINKNAITVSEVKDIEQYISTIYMWKEITNEALPRFDNVNNAPDLWVWEVVKKNLEEYELTYDQIENKAKEIFGENLEKKFPKEGSEYMKYNESLDRYLAEGIVLDSEDDSFFLSSIEKNRNEYKIEIVEYLEDYTENLNVKSEDEQYNIYIKNLNNDVIGTISSIEEEKTIDIVKENIDKFSKKEIRLIKDKEGKIFVKSIE